MATVGRDVQHPFWVSLKKEESLPESLWLSSGSLMPLAFASIAPSLGHYRHARVVGGGDPGTGGCLCCSGSCSGGFCLGSHYDMGERRGSCQGGGGQGCPG
jgi:hypothetical protein